MADNKQEEHLDEQQLVVFSLAGEAYGIDINAVREIIRMQTITNVPRTPEFVEGVINLRGKVIPVVNLRMRFGLPVVEQTDDHRIVWVDIQGQDIGMIVDAVTEVTRIKTDSVEPPSSVITTAESDYLAGLAKLDGRMIILLELDRVLAGAADHASERALGVAAAA
ncbi:MAG: chemotaxis protein CheW [Chloroflexi bacterium]|nr:chemotaxis protein CheW [Chloroflexota bacterium]